MAPAEAGSWNGGIVMDVAVVYESIFGNTRSVAEAIAAGVRDADPAARVSVLRAAEAKPADVAGAGLLVVGGPTHIMRMSSARTRQQGLASVQKGQGAHRPPEPAAAGPGIREWLAGLPAAPAGGQAAAFDTRLGYPLSGSAAGPAARELRRHGYRLAAKAAGFIVTGSEGPLRDGELDRARTWGASLARQAGLTAAS